MCGSLGGVDVTLNVLLFVPLGAALALAGVGRARAVILGLLATLTIETLQGTLIPGRDAALGDVVMNTLGTLLGFELARTRTRWLLPDRATAMRLAVVAAITWLGILVASLQLLRPAAATGTLMVDPHPASVFIRPFDGRVTALALNGTALRTDTPTEVEAGSWSGPRIDMTLRADPTAGSRTGAIVRIAESTTDREFTMLARRGDALTFRPRTRGMDLMLRGPLLELSNVFVAGDADMPHDLYVTAGRSGWTLYARVQGGASVRMALRASHGWTLIAPFTIPLTRYAPWLSIAWMATLVLPVGYWSAAALATQSRRDVLLPVVAYTVLAAAGMVGTSWVFDAPMPEWGDFAGVAIGLACGSVLARTLVGRRQRSATFTHASGERPPASGRRGP
ncbi:MAG TPA: VanZ family protein [Gemmatimonadaceae bacterium]|nr:VanZ family protein [Gemmatimonadaceae bacterium]